MKNSAEKSPKPPKTLSREAAALWRKLIAEYGITDEGGLLLLGTAMEAFTRMRQVQAALTKDGLIVRDRFGQAKAHPLCTIERDSRAQMLAALKHLNLDLEPINPRIGRPGGS